jgi:hypothetical protein
MTGAQVEYVGFVTTGAWREYTLRARPAAGAGDWRIFTLAIASAAFLANRVRYQDAPDICFLKLQRELLAHPGEYPEAHLSISDAELEDYRVSHAPKTNQRR